MCLVYSVGLYTGIQSSRHVVPPILLVVTQPDSGRPSPEIGKSTTYYPSTPQGLLLPPPRDLSVCSRLRTTRIKLDETGSLSDRFLLQKIIHVSGSCYEFSYFSNCILHQSQIKTRKHFVDTRFV